MPDKKAQLKQDLEREIVRLERELALARWHYGNLTNEVQPVEMVPVQEWCGWYFKTVMKPKGEKK